MKNFFKQFLKIYLKYLAKTALLINKPVIIAVAGSINKTFVKEAVENSLKKNGFSVRGTPKSFNTDIGLSLAILNIPSGYNSYKNWAPIILKAFWSLFNRMPEYLVLELGVSTPQDMKFLLTIIRPKFVIITDITQRYLESFGNMDELVAEYEYLLNKSESAIKILNFDNSRIRALAKHGHDKIEFFSLDLENLNENLTWRILKIVKQVDGQTIKINGRGEESFKINRFGDHHAYSLLISLIIDNYVGTKKNI